MSDLSCCVPLTLDPFQMFEFYERVSGARMHAAYVRPGGVHQVRVYAFHEDTQVMRNCNHCNLILNAFPGFAPGPDG